MRIQAFPPFIVMVSVIACVIGCGGPNGAKSDTKSSAARSDPSVSPVKTPSGLEYVDLVVGTGPTPARGDTVAVHYTGWLTNGSKFASSRDRGDPYIFRLGYGEVVKGWDEGIASMKLGGKRKLTVPPALAYGERVQGGGLIPANSTLVFEVELIEIR